MDVSMRKEHLGKEPPLLKVSPTVLKISRLYKGKTGNGFA